MCGNKVCVSLKFPRNVLFNDLKPNAGVAPKRCHKSVDKYTFNFSMSLLKTGLTAEDFGSNASHRYFLPQLYHSLKREKKGTKKIVEIPILTGCLIFVEIYLDNFSYFLILHTVSRSDMTYKCILFYILTCIQINSSLNTKLTNIFY